VKLIIEIEQKKRRIVKMTRKHEMFAKRQNIVDRERNFLFLTPSSFFSFLVFFCCY